MTNQERITAHNALIDEAIEKANSLPDAGGGSGEAVINSLTITGNGTYNAPSGVDGYNPITVNVPTESGIEIPSSSAATAIDIAKDKQAEVNGTLVTGSVQTITGQYNTSSSSNAAAGGKLYLDKTFSSPILFRKNSYIELTTSLSNLGDATAEDVAAGKTFTSVAGKKVTGTHVCESGGGGLPSGVTALASGTVTPTSDATSYLEITHNLGVAPNFLVWQNTADFSNTAETGAAIGGLMLKKDVRYSTSGTNNYNLSYFVTGYNSNGILAATTQRGNSADDDMSASTALIRTTSTYPLKAGHTYHWVCGVME